MRPKLWEQTEMSWTGTKLPHFIHSDVQKPQTFIFYNSSHLALKLKFPKWERSFNLPIIDSSAFSTLKQSLSG